MLLSHVCRHLQQHGLMKLLNGATTLNEPTHDRRERRRPDSIISQCRLALRDRNSDARQPGDALMLEYCSWRDRKACLKARLTNLIDRMLSPPSAKKLSSIDTAMTPKTSPK